MRPFVVATALVSLCTSLGACKKEDKKPPEGDKKPGELTAEKADPGVKADPGPGPSVIKAGGNADDLSLLPRDSEIVAGVNFGQMQGSALWKKFVEPKLLKGGDMPPELVEFKDTCGMDPMTAVRSVSLGLKNVGSSKPDGVVVMHGVDKAKALECVDKMKDKAAQKGVKFERDGDVVLISGKGDQYAATFAGNDTVVMVVGPTASKDTLMAVTAGGSALKTSPAFVDMYNKIKTADSLWVLVNGNMKGVDQLHRMGIKPKAIYGSVNVTDGISADLRMRVDTPDDATRLAAGFQGQVQPFATMVDQLGVVGDGSDVRFTVAISETKLQQLIKNFGSLLGGLAGGGLGGTP